MNEQIRRGLMGFFKSKNTSRTLDAMALRREGDLARDRREWPASDKHYSAYLELKPADEAIWVQLGHALKEQNKLDAAENAYRRATELAPLDGDAHLHLGHVLKQQGKRADAVRAFAKSFEIAPKQSTFEDMAAQGGAQLASEIFDNATRQNAADTLLFEIDDLLGWLHAHRTLSGIQRVQVGIIRNVLSRISSNDNQHYGFVCTKNDQAGLWQLWPSDVQDLVAYATSDDVRRDELTRLIAKAEQCAILVKPAKGQCYFILGAFWGFGRDLSRFARLKDAGVCIGVYIYDLIPMTHPEFCDAALVADFTMALSDGMAVFDFILTISDFTAHEVRRLQTSLNLRPIPVQPVPLAHLLNEQTLEEASSGWTPAISALKGKRFALSVSTIEIRKNHAYLVAAWRLMLDEGLDPPDLVLVGRYGWRVNDLMEQMRATQFLNGRIHVLHDLTDAELQMLYHSCQFTAFPSFVEGWGLPVGESLAHGRPCIASNTSSIPEVGGDLVDYVDPFNVREGVAAFKHMAFDAAYREKRERKVKADFKPRTWPNVSADLLKRIKEFRHLQTDVAHGPLLLPGELFIPSEMAHTRAIPRNYATRPLRTILAESWYAPEDFGVWMRGDTAMLRFRTDLAPGSEVTAYLRLAGAPWSINQMVHTSANEDVDDTNDDPGKPPAGSVEQAFPQMVRRSSGSRRIITSRFIIRIAGRVVENGVMTIRLHVTGEPTPAPLNDSRQLSVGLIALAYAETSQLELRGDIGEALTELC